MPRYNNAAKSTKKSVKFNKANKANKMNKENKPEYVAIQPINFSWSINGKQSLYEPSMNNVLTYFIPRVHVSVDEEFLMTVLREYFDGTTGNYFDCNTISRVDFAEIEGNENFKQAFVYHTQMTERDEINHFNRMCSIRNIWRSAEYPMTMNIVNRITQDIFIKERNNSPFRVNFTHKGRKNFWILLPNLNPLTEFQKEMADMLGDIHKEIIDELMLLCEQNVDIPDAFDKSILEYNKVDTAWEPIDYTSEKMNEKLIEYKTELQKLIEYANKKNVLSTIDMDAMEDLEFQYVMEDLEERE